jgi:NAD(P)H-dependent FMN reductase
MPSNRAEIKVLVFDASLRRDSHNRRLAQLVARFAQDTGATVELGTLADFDCPSYDYDVEADSGMPAPAERLRRSVIANDAFIIASPEYNASMPGVLKNVIDWTSRFRPQPFNGKQCLLVSASPSMAGGNRGLWSLRIPLEHLGARVYPDMFSLARSHEAYDASGELKNAELRRRFDETLRCFLDLVEAAKHYPAVRKQWVEFLGEHPDSATDRVESADSVAA